MTAKAFDIVIVGMGQTAPPLAHALAKAGKRVAVVERWKLGGSCVNFGCTPTKAALASAKLAHQARRGGDYGLKIAAPKVDFAAVIARAHGFAEKGRLHLEEGFTDKRGPQLIRGHARLWGRKGERLRLVVDDGPELTAEHVVIDTGTRALLPPTPGLMTTPHFTADRWLERDTLPKHLLILGGGPVGCEFAQFYRRMGAEVTVVDGAGHLLPHEDADVAAALADLFEAEGIKVRCGVKVERVEATESGGVRLHVKKGSPIEGSDLFVGVGRMANTDDLGLDSLGLSAGRNGVLKVDKRLGAGVPGLWAAGDVRGGLQLTSTAWDDHRVLLSQLAGDGKRTTKRVVPYAVFTDPELGRVGLSESQARADDIPHRAHRFPMTRIAKAREDGAEAGFIKLITDPKGRRLLGAAILGEGGSELIHLCALVMQAKLPPGVIVDGIYAHPTLAEGLQSAFTDALS